MSAIFILCLPTSNSACQQLATIENSSFVLLYCSRFQSPRPPPPRRPPPSLTVNPEIFWLTPNRFSGRATWLTPTALFASTWRVTPILQTPIFCWVIFCSARFSHELLSSGSYSLRLLTQLEPRKP